MRPGPVPVVPAGKRPKIKKRSQGKGFYKNLITWFKAKKVRAPLFAVTTSLMIVLFLGLYDYFSNFVYVVRVNDREVGVVGDAKDIESFVIELTDRCGELYGMNMEPGAKIDLVKEFRPESKPVPEDVQTVIRSQLTFLADAYMITVDGEPLAPVQLEADLARLVELLKEGYSYEDQETRVLGAYVVEDLRLQPCSVEPEAVKTPEEIFTLLTAEPERAALQHATLLQDYSSRGVLESRQSLSFEQFFTDSEYPVNEVAVEDENLNGALHVRVVEELTVIEPIPFDTEVVYDDQMWIVQKEITTPGEEGSKELIFHITRDNGEIVSRYKAGETVISEPVTQIESIGTAQVPSIGTGQFIWPVEGGGEVTPGRGFSTWHTGIDIHSQSGTNVLAADSGVVWFSGWGATQGNYLIVYHGSYWTLYLHNSANLVREGMQVEKGEVIAHLGSTGRSTGPHLHFEVRRDDGSNEWLTYYQHQPIDPLQFFRP